MYPFVATPQPPLTEVVNNTTPSQTEVVRAKCGSVGRWCATATVVDTRAAPGMQGKLSHLRYLLYGLL